MIVLERAIHLLIVSAAYEARSRDVPEASLFTKWFEDREKRLMYAYVVGSIGLTTARILSVAKHLLEAP